MKRNVFSFCITHDEPLIPSCMYDEKLSLGSYGLSGKFHVSKLGSFWDENRGLSYGAAGSYSIPSGISIGNIEADLLMICAYRKVILNKVVGRESANYWGMRLVDVKSGESITRNDALPKEGAEFLLSPPLEFKDGVYAQYGQAHKAIDFLDYTTLAMKMGVLSEHEAAEFVSMKHLIPGGCEIGVYPFSWCVEKLSILEKLGREFISTYADRISSYDPYQIRAVGFLSERLGSFFLIRELLRRYPAGIPEYIFGHLTTFVPEGGEYSGNAV